MPPAPPTRIGGSRRAQSSRFDEQGGCRARPRPPPSSPTGRLRSSAVRAADTQRRRDGVMPHLEKSVAAGPRRDGYPGWRTERGTDATAQRAAAACARARGRPVRSIRAGPMCATPRTPSVTRAIASSNVAAEANSSRRPRLNFARREVLGSIGAWTEQRRAWTRRSAPDTRDALVRPARPARLG